MLELGMQILARSASLFQKGTTPTNTPTSDYNSKTRPAPTLFSILSKCKWVFVLTITFHQNENYYCNFWKKYWKPFWHKIL